MKNPNEIHDMHARFEDIYSTISPILITKAVDIPKFTSFLICKINLFNIEIHENRFQQSASVRICLEKFLDQCLLIYRRKYRENHSVVLRYEDLVNIYSFIIMNEVRICLPTKLTVNERISVFKVTLNEYLRDRDYCMQRKFEKHLQLKRFKNIGRGMHYSSARLFGISLELLTDDLQPMPVTVERCIKDVELRGLEVPGIYRKSPNMESITALCNALEQDLYCNLIGYPVITIAALVKQFFRQLPEPLLTFSLYPKLIEAAKIDCANKRTMTLNSLIESLPKANLCILDRMIVHLARIAICEKNFMTTSSLAIIFAPNLLRSKNSDKEDEFRDISKKTIILETLLSDCEVKLKTEYGC